MIKYYHAQNGFCYSERLGNTPFGLCFSSSITIKVYRNGFVSAETMLYYQK